MIPLLASLLLAPLAAQVSPQTRPATEQTERHDTPALISLSDLMDKKVHLQPGPGAKIGADETAEIEDLVIDSTGEIRLIAIRAGGWFEDDRTVLVPISRIRHDTMRENGEVERRCTLSMTEAELKRLPVFDPDEIRDPAALEARIRSVESSFPRQDRTGDDMQRERRPANGTGGTEGTGGQGGQGDQGDAGDQRGRTGGDVQTRTASEASMRAHGYLLASDLLELDVQATDESFGEVSDAAVSEHRIDYLIVSRGGALGIGGDDYLVPLAAANVTFERKEGSDERECRVVLPKSVAQLERGVRHVDPDGDAFVAPDAAQRADEFFGTQSRSGDAMRRKAGDDVRREPGDSRGGSGERERPKDRGRDGGRSDS